MDAAIAIDDEMIADAFPAFGFMPAVDVGNCIVTAFGGGTTMDDDLLYFHRRKRDFRLIVNLAKSTNRTPVRKKKQIRHNRSKGVRGLVISFTSVTVT